MSKLFSALLCCWLGGANGISDSSWTAMINHMGRQRMLSQKMSKEFLQIAKGIDVEKSKQNLTGTINLYDTTLVHLINGTQEKNYATPPELVQQGLDVVSDVWSTFKALLLDNMDVITPDDIDVLSQLQTQSMTVLKKSNAVVGRYVDAAKSAGATVAGLLVDIAGRQRMLTQKMAKEALLIGLNVNKAANLGALSGTVNLFAESHEGILRGQNFVGIVQKKKMCTLWQMRTVTAKWSEVRPIMLGIMDDEAASDQVLQQVAPLSMVLLVEMAEAVKLYVKDTDTSATFAATADQCGIPRIVDAGGWSKLINKGGAQRKFGQEASRLFLQIAKGVKTTESSIELGTTLNKASNSLRELIEGSEAMNVPAPPTQEIADRLTDLWTNWVSFADTLTANAAASPIAPEVVLRVGRMSRQTLTGMNEAVEMMVVECLRVMPSVNPVVINIAGRQRMYMQQMSKEALLVSLNQDVADNRQRVEDTVLTWLDVHWTLLLGRPGGNGTSAIARTTNVCLLRQMNIALNAFNDLRPVVQEVAQRSMWLTETEVTSRLEQQHDLNGPAFKAMHAAVGMFASKTDVCDLSLFLDEWHQVFKGIGRSRLLIERMTTEYIFRALDLVSTTADAPEGSERRLQDDAVQQITSTLSADMTELEALLHSFTYGNSSAHVPTPPSQEIANGLFQLTDQWPAFKALLDTRATAQGADQVLALGSQLATTANQTQTKYLQNVMSTTNNTIWNGIDKANRQAVLVQQIAREAAMFSLPSCASCQVEKAKLPASIDAFDAMMVFDQSDVQAAAEAEKMVVRWGEMRRTLQSMQATYEESQELPPSSTLIEILGEAAEVVAHSKEVSDLLITSTETTTRITLELLVPLPLTGTWSAGKSMRAAILVAQDIINTQQKILPGYELVSNFFDDECSEDNARNVVLSQITGNKNNIALGGMGCTHSCKMVASITPYMSTPSMSYACAGPSLSDNSSMPDFARMGNNMRSTPGLVAGLAEKYGWNQITLVVDKNDENDEHARFLLSSLEAIDGVSVDRINAENQAFSSAEAVANEFRTKKRRVIFLVGDEVFKRRVVCASRVVGANVGITWITEGKEAEGWLTVEDASFASQCTAADMEESFDGALNIVGQEYAHDEDAPLDCFEEHTAKSFKVEVDSVFKNGFAGDNATAVEQPYDVAAKAADGTCVLAYTIAEMLKVATIDELRAKTRYQDFVSMMKQANFRGVSGRVRFEGNDMPGTVVVRQRRANLDEETMVANPWQMLDVAVDYGNGTTVLDLNGGVSEEAYKPAKEEVEERFPYEILQVVIVLLFICCPFCCGMCYVYHRISKNRSSGDANAKGRAAGSAGGDMKV